MPSKQISSQDEPRVKSTKQSDIILSGEGFGIVGAAKGLFLRILTLAVSRHYSVLRARMCHLRDLS
jgi:hypothetical protein